MEHKVVMLGDGGVGRTAITIQFMSNRFVEDYDPTIEDVYRKNVIVDDENSLLDVLDTAGEEEYSAMVDQYMRTGEGFLVVYSITCKRSLDFVSNLYSRIKQVKDDEPFAMVLVGNKIDLETTRVVSTEEGRELAEALNCPFFETSAKERINIDESYLELVRVMRKLSSETHLNK